MADTDIAQLMARALQAHQQGQLAVAGEIYEQVLQRDEDVPEAIHYLGVIALQQYRLEDAAQRLQRALELQPDNSLVHHNFARLQEALGQLDAAAHGYAQAHALAPENPDTLFSLGNTYLALGDLAQAEEAYLDTLAIEPAYAPAFRQLMRLRKQTEESPLILQMVGLVEGPEVPVGAKVHLGFGLGKAFEDLGDAEQAFQYYEMANQAQRSQLRFDMDQWDKEVDRIVSAFQPEFFNREAAIETRGQRLIFILGLPRSGSTLVEQILGSHSAVHPGGELQFLQQTLMQGMDVARFPESITSLETDDFSRLNTAYFKRVQQLVYDEHVLTDKKLDNFKLLGMIYKLFPDAIVLHTMRDSLDNGWSLFKNYFADSGPFYSYDQVEIARYIKGYQRLMTHWQKMLPGYVHDVRYEALVADPEVEIRRILKACDLPFESGCLEFYKQERGVQTASALQVRQPIYASSAGSADQFSQYLEPMARALS